MMDGSETIYNICERVDSEIASDFGGGCPIEKSFLMAYLIQNQKLKTYVEIGIYRGKSLFPAAYSIYLNGGRSYGIDPYSYEDAKEADAPENLQGSIDDFLPKVDFDKMYQDVIMYREGCGYGDNLKIIRKPSQDAIEYFKKNKIKIDCLHIDGNHDTEFVRQDFELYNDILAEGGFVIFDDIDWESVNVVYKEAKKKLTLVYECAGYGVLYKEKGAVEDFVKIEKLRKRLTAVCDRIKNRKSEAGAESPLITVGVLTYNHEDYIKECLQSVVGQSGSFRSKIIILDDASTDGTKEAVEDFLKGVAQSDYLQIEYIRNKKNLGVVKNYNKLVRLIRESGCDFFTFCEGDDFYLNNGRLEAHLRLHLNSPELALSFNKLLLYYQEKNKYEVCDPDFNSKTLSTEKLVMENKPGSFCSSFYDSSVLDYVKNDLFEDMFTVDWMFNIFCSQFGDIGHISLPMSVYRKHSKGVWSGNKEIHNCRTLDSNIYKYNKYLDFLYDREFQVAHNNCAKYLDSNDAAELYDVVVIDDVFPHPLSGFSYQEFTNILGSFKKAAVYTTGGFSRCLSEDSIENLIVAYKREHSEFGNRVFKLSKDSCFRAKLLYGIFLNTAYHDLLYWADRLCTPFMFTLYPGGGFFLDNEESDEKLRAVFASPWFKKVIVTQQVTYDYLLDNGFCKKEDIEFIFGVVTDENKIKNEGGGKKHFGLDKKTLDVCFVAHKYTKDGRDKGYDLFVGAAKKIAKKYKDIAFHVVGPWDENTLDVSGANIVFYGSRLPDWFFEFYKDKDIIVSANTNGVLANGAFDGFPTTSVTDAALCGVAMFCTDPLGLNGGRFKDGEEIVIIEHSVDSIEKKIKYYYKNPKMLKDLCEKGKSKSRILYSYKEQMAPRVEAIRNVIKMIDEGKSVKFAKGAGASSKEDELGGRPSKLRLAAGKVTPRLVKKAYRKTGRIVRKIKQI